jgi:hypothetical protein
MIAYAPAEMIPIKSCNDNLRKASIREPTIFVISNYEHEIGQFDNLMNTVFESFPDQKRDVNDGVVGYSVSCHFQQYLSHIVTFSFVGGVSRVLPTCCKSLTNFIT